MSLEETTDIVALAAKAENGVKQYRLTVVNAGISEPSSTCRLAKEITDKARTYLEARDKAVVVEMVNLKGIAEDIAKASVTFESSDQLEKAISAVTASDGLVVASPIYKASYSGLFKSFWDLVPRDAITNMPLVLAATGGSNRHALVPDVVMRGLFAFFRAVPTATSLMATKEDFDTPELEKRERRAATELGALMLSGVRHEPVDQPSEGLNW
ncbi:NAD(P)H-dependent oxidoreductase [Bifidobacterium sp. ESL0798]|uniref:CE1759 family FMN reductase n=1 Tax=unclassified Bifidobacterium TaxID=2608897 RepID=UPI0023F82C66|nr:MULTISPECIES: CE1759 family FMN reductase [unclassified Bifidobacterium]WEV52520.1 NAD(P)H-dependent oxidoreductase [Bifidobacterium sp. ESL0704]WEV74503.1 NAD(P)H-dependent oxidoreductase [Bifidobacterium sp. ESL0798]